MKSSQEIKKDLIEVVAATEESRKLLERLLELEPDIEFRALAGCMSDLKDWAYQAQRQLWDLLKQAESKRMADMSKVAYG